MRITDDCMSCGQCQTYCEQDAIKELKGTGYAQYYIDSEFCINCRECLNVDCPADAIKED